MHISQSITFIIIIIIIIIIYLFFCFFKVNVIQPFIISLMFCPNFYNKTNNSFMSGTGRKQEDFNTDNL